MTVRGRAAGIAAAALFFFGRATASRPEAADAPGGDAAGTIQVASLIYGGTKSSVCFSPHFLEAAEQAARISTTRRFHEARADSRELFQYPFAIMTGEGAFSLPVEERGNLRDWLRGGGFLLASAGCSSPDWDQAFRAEIQAVLPGFPLRPLSMEHPIFHTVTDIGSIEARHGTPKAIEGIEIDGRLALVYSADGLNDTAHVSGCCCCGGNEVRNAIDINVNILLYALTH